MATKWILLICVLATVASHTQSRVLNHPMFKFLSVTTTTQRPTTGLEVEARDPDPGAKFPSRDELYLNYLINRKNYFQNNGWSDTRNSGDNSATSTVRTTKPSQTSYSAVFPETSQKQVTQNAQTTKINAEMSNDGRTPNRGPTTKIPGSQPNLDNDRDIPLSLTDLWFQRIMRPPSLLQSWGRTSTNEDTASNPTSTPQTNNQPPKVEVISMETTASQSETSTNDARYVSDTDSNDKANLVNDKPTDSPAYGVTDGNWQEPTDVEVQDKPFYGTDLDKYFGKGYTDKTRQNGSRKYNTRRPEGGYRYSRAASVGAENSNGTSCYDTASYQPCQYLTRCFPDIEKRCQSHGSFIGDKVGRFCAKTMESSLTAQSEKLRNYLRKVDECVRVELSAILESPSCDDVTVSLTRALLVKSTTSCLYQNGLMCNIMEDKDARPGLARILNSRTTDVDFMSRLMVNIGDLTSYCRGQGSSIFVTDITVLATAKDGPFGQKYSQSPITGVVQKN